MDNTRLVTATKLYEKFLEAKRQNFHIYVALAVGYIKGMAAALDLYKTLDLIPNVRELIDGVFTGSGSNPPSSIWCTGSTAAKGEEVLRMITFGDTIGTQKISLRYLLANLRKHGLLPSPAAPLTVEHIEKLARRLLPTNSFDACKPDLFIIATKLQSAWEPVVFSKFSIPTVPISQAQAASLAVEFIFEPYQIGNELYIDAAEAEPLAIQTIIEYHTKQRGLPLEKLFILALVVDDVGAPKTDHLNVLPWLTYYTEARAKRMVLKDVFLSELLPIKLVLVTPQFKNIKPSLPKKTPRIRRLLEKMDIEHLGLYLDHLEREQIISRLLMNQLDRLSFY